jgi:hypothetical protein
VISTPSGKSIHNVRLDPGDGRQRVGRVLVKVWSHGALSVEGPLGYKAWCLAVIDEAIGALNGKAHGTVGRPPPVVPGQSDTVADPEEIPETAAIHVVQRISLGVWSDGALSIEGPVTDKAWCLAALANARDAVKRYRRAGEQLVVPPEDVEVAAPIHALL